MIGNHVLSVDVYFEELGTVQPDFDASNPVTQIPQNTEYNIPDACIARFIFDHPEAREEIDRQLCQRAWAKVYIQVMILMIFLLCSGCTKWGLLLTVPNLKDSNSMVNIGLFGKDCVLKLKCCHKD